MNFKQSVQDLLSNHFQKKISVIDYSSLGGGSINSAYRVNTDEGVYFVKTNSKDSFPEMFSKEARGLELLANANCVGVPEIICYGDIESDSFLILEYIEESSKSHNFWDEFAKNLACLHKKTSTKFGLDHDNYIGSLVQFNEFKESWSEFFTLQRLEKQLKMAIDAYLIDKSIINYFERFYKRIDEIFPQEEPSLIHGDLWSGNYMSGPDSQAMIIDPAVYYGHREMDLGMSLLFGGFSGEFYDSYNRYFPMEKGWQKRMEYCNLYPLLVHVNLFGGSYSSSVKSIITKF
ncbi:MAG: ketosamine-3-kinase [Marinilabiliales bacterium]|nr:MAG: ketosamine-3-kinase [Marinilabiliales bacterium]